MNPEGSARRMLVSLFALEGPVRDTISLPDVVDLRCTYITINRLSAHPSVRKQGYNGSNVTITLHDHEKSCDKGLYAV